MDGQGTAAIREAVPPEGSGSWPIRSGGLPVERAADLLRFSPRKAPVFSTGARIGHRHAEHNEGADIDELTVKSVCIDRGPVHKRWKPRGARKGEPDREAHEPRHGHGSRSSMNVVHERRPPGGRAGGTRLKRRARRWDRRYIRSACDSGSSRTGHRPGTRGTRDYASYLLTDLEVSRLHRRRLSTPRSATFRSAGRPATPASSCTTARPGIVIGKKGEDTRAASPGRRPAHGLSGSTSESRRSASPSWTPGSWRRASPISSSGGSCSAVPCGVRSTNAIASRGGAHQGDGGGPAERSGDRSFGVVPRGPGSAAHPARGLSTTAWPKRAPRTGSSG